MGRKINIIIRIIVLRLKVDRQVIYRVKYKNKNVFKRVVWIMCFYLLQINWITSHQSNNKIVLTKTPSTPTPTPTPTPTKHLQSPKSLIIYLNPDPTTFPHPPTKPSNNNKSNIFLQVITVVHLFKVLLNI